MTCKNCKWLNIPLNSNGQRRALKDRAYKCEVEIPEPLLPVSVTQAYNFNWPPPRRFMEGSDGEGCKMFESITKGEQTA